VPDTLPSSPLPDTTPIRRLIRRTRRLLRSSWVVTGLGLTVGLLLGTLVAATLVDLVAPLGTAFRLAALVLIAVPAALVLLVGVVRPLFTRLRPVAVARRIEKHIPGIHNRLVSSLDLAGSPARQPVSQAFYRRLLGEALERIRGFRPHRVLDLLRLRRASLYALASTGAFLLALLLFSDRLPTAIARILNPFADIPPASGVVYRVSPGDHDVLRGEDIAFAATVEKGEPDRLYLEVTSPDGDETLRYDLRKQKGNVWSFTLSSNLPDRFRDGFSYRVYGGGTWSPLCRIRTVERPEIVGLYPVLHYPAYMALPPEPRVSPGQLFEVAGPRGGQVEVVVKAQGNVRQGQVQLLRMVKERHPVKDRSERVWFDRELPAGAQAVDWHWSPEAYQQRPFTHAAPAGDGQRTHGFSAATAGFVVQPGEHLFAHVYLVPGELPDAIMLQWHDGVSWEHRAYWGADRIKFLGQPNTASRLPMGPMPEAGRWVRLEVPAAAVGLDGKTLHGMAFTQVNGRSVWQSAGALPPSHVEAEVARPYKHFAMKARPDNVWAGRFPLEGQGLYRVELKNALGHANKAMKELKYTALDDHPPQVLLNSPEGDLTLSKPAKVKLDIRALDDYGLKEVRLYLRRGENGPWSDRLVKRYRKPVCDDNNLSAVLDLAQMKMVLGDSLQFYVEAVDRKGQKAVSSRLTIRLATHPDAADQQLAAFEKSQDPFEQRLANLIAAQAQVQKGLEQMQVKYTPLAEKIKAAREAAQARLDPASAKLIEAVQTKLTELAREKDVARELGLKPAKPNPNQPPPVLDAESAKVLADTRQMLTDLAVERQKNSPEPNAPARPDAESEQLLKDMADKLAELARQKAQNAAAGGKAKTPTPSAKLDRDSAKVLADLRKKLAQLEMERDKNVQVGKSTSTKPVQLDPQTAQQLAAMQKELAELAQKQQQNFAQGDLLSKDLARSAEEAKKLQMLRGQLARLMESTQQNFEQHGVQAMKDLVQNLNQAATAKPEAIPDKTALNKMSERGRRLQGELEALKQRMAALARARKNLLNDPDALKALQNEMLRQDSQLTARDLKELRDHLARLRDELKRQKGKQEDLKGQTTKAPAKDLPDLEKKQDHLEFDLFKVLDLAKKLQDAEKGKRLNRKRKPQRPKSPYTPEADEENVPPREEDSDEPLPDKKKGKATKDKTTGDKDKTKKPDDEDDNEKKYLPQLGGKKEKIDPRYAKKKLPVRKKPKQGDAEDSDDRREDLERRQDDNLRDLDSAEKSLDADSQTLDGMLGQLERALQKSKNNGKGNDSEAGDDSAMQQLLGMMQSNAMRQAMALAARMRQAQGQNAGQPQTGQPMNGNNPNLTGQHSTGKPEEADLSKIDLPTRTLILQMQPKHREELLEGMRSEGPEGYEKHIQEYYKRLLKTKGVKK
jgi:hypothetical protein